MGSTCGKGANGSSLGRGRSLSETSRSKLHDQAQNVYIISDMYSIQLQCFSVSTHRLLSDGSNMTQGCKYVAVSKITVCVNKSQKAHKLSSVMHVPMLTWSGLNVKAQFPKYLPMNLWPGDYAIFGFFHPDTSSKGKVTLTGKVGNNDVRIETNLCKPPMLPEDDIAHLTKLLQEEMSKIKTSSVSKEESRQPETSKSGVASTKMSQDTGYFSNRVSVEQSPYSGLTYSVVESSDSDDATPKRRTKEKKSKLKRKDTPSQHSPFMKIKSPGYKPKGTEGPLIEETEAGTVTVQKYSAKADGPFDVDDCSDTPEDNQRSVSPYPLTPVPSPRLHDSTSPALPSPSMMLYDSLPPISPTSPKISTELLVSSPDESAIAPAGPASGDRRPASGDRRPVSGGRQTAGCGQLSSVPPDVPNKTALWVECQGVYTMPGRLTRSAQNIKSLTDIDVTDVENQKTHSVGPSPEFYRIKQKKKKISITSKLASKPKESTPCLPEPSRESISSVPEQCNEIETGEADNSHKIELKTKHDDTCDADDEEDANQVYDKTSDASDGNTRDAERNVEQSIEPVASNEQIKDDSDQTDVKAVLDDSSDKGAAVAESKETRDNDTRKVNKGQAGKDDTVFDTRENALIENKKTIDTIRGKLAEYTERPDSKTKPEHKDSISKFSLSDVMETQIVYSKTVKKGEVMTKLNESSIGTAQKIKSMSRASVGIDSKPSFNKKGRKRSGFARTNFADSESMVSSAGRKKAQSVSAVSRSEYQSRKVVSLEARAKETENPKEESQTHPEPMEAFADSSNQ